MLLEKAWAKVHGTYVRSEAGLPYFAASHLLGVPSVLFQHADIKDEAAKKQYFHYLDKCDKKNFIMMGSSKGQGERVKDNGIVEGHAYALVNVHSIKKEDF
jgi:calpain-15